MGGLYRTLKESLQLAKERVNRDTRDKQDKQLNANGGTGGKGVHAPQPMLAPVNATKA